MTKPAGPPYKSPLRNVWYTQSIFYEAATTSTAKHAPDHEPVFSLYDDIPGLINARRTFVELGDPTGYKWAMEYLKDWDHWTRLMKCEWFREAYEFWLTELKTKLQSEAIERLKKIAAGSTPQAIQAAKFIATFDWERDKKGRPSKRELDAEMKRITATLTEEDEDLQRIGILKVIPGGKAA